MFTVCSDYVVLPWDILYNCMYYIIKSYSKLSVNLVNVTSVSLSTLHFIINEFGTIFEVLQSYLYLIL